MKKNMILLAMSLIMGASVAFAQQPATQKKSAAKISLADARSRIDKAISDSRAMAIIMRNLSAADQKQFLADVNKAISEMPASTEEKTALFLNANSAALRNAAPGNLSTLVAETFATVPTESLTVLSEHFAEDLFNRSADTTTSYTDAQFSKIASDLMAKISDRCKDADNAGPREALAILMLVRASGGTPADLADNLVENIKNEEAREMARTEWIPSALGKDGREKSYESLLASADAGQAPNNEFVLVIAGPQFHDSLLHDLTGGNIDPTAAAAAGTPVLDAAHNVFTEQIPALGAGQVEPGAGGVIEPEPYQFQRTR